jgi:hypothetical protein
VPRSSSQYQRGTGAATAAPEDSGCCVVCPQGSKPCRDICVLAGADCHEPKGCAC